MSPRHAPMALLAAAPLRTLLRHGETGLSCPRMAQGSLLVSLPPRCTPWPHHLHGARGPVAALAHVIPAAGPVAGVLLLAGRYVGQEDLLFPSLTVRETLLFSARLRLPPKMGPELRRRRVGELVELLGLDQCAETLIGSTGVSSRGTTLEQ